MPDARTEFAGRETDILQALGIAWSSKRKIRCPFPDHEDRDPSWRWDEGARKYFCSCSNGDIFDVVARMKGCRGFMDAVEASRALLGTFDRQVAKPTRKAVHKPQAAAPNHVPVDAMPRPSALRHPKFGKPALVDAYHDRHGMIVELRVRYDLEAREGEKRNKVVLPYIFNGQRWINEQMDGMRPLYRLTELLSAGPDVPVLIVEGEPAARAADKLFEDYSVTTTSGGAHAFARADYSDLKGRQVVIWPDNDEPGRAYAEGVARLALAAGAFSVRIVDVPREWPKGWDLADPVPSDSIDIREMVEDAPIWKPAKLNGNGADHRDRVNGVLSTSAKPAGDKLPRFPIIPLSAIRPILSGQWLVKRLLPAKGLAVVYGAPGCGKSFLVLHAMLHVASGREWAKCKTTPTAVVYVAAEGQAGFANRVHTAAQRLQLAAETPFGLIAVAPNLGTQKGDAAELIQEIKAQMQALGWTRCVIVIDTLSRTMFGADESAPEGMGSFIANAGLIAEAFDSLVVAIHHKGKDEARGMRGWSGLHGACDCEWEVVEDNGKHSVVIPKMKDGPDGLTWDFALRSVDIGVDEDGAPVTTCIVEIEGEPQHKSQHENVAPVPLKGQRAEFLKAVKWAIEEAGEPMPGIGRTPKGVRGVTRHKLRRYVENLGFFEGKADNAQRAMMSRHIADLAGNRRLGQWSEWIWIP